MADLRFGNVTIEHPSGRERSEGVGSKVYLQLFRPSGRNVEVPVSEDELIKLIAEAAGMLQILREKKR